MNFLVFALTYPFIWVFSRLPLSILHLFSDFFYFIIYYVIGYRKKVVYTNISLAFPEKSEDEIKAISKKFFQHFTDIIIESIKSFSISEKEIKKRYVYKNVELFKELEEKEKSIILTGTHYANWEWIFYLNRYVNYLPYAAYAKVKNPFFEKKLKTSRGKFGTQLIRTNNVLKTLLKNKANNKKAVYGLLSDQSPQLHKTHYWTEFLGVKVPVITGPEMLAKKYDLMVVNFNVTRVKRGYYEIEFELVTDNALQFKDYELTDHYLKTIETHIKKDPAFYLWSHKRFKHKDKYEEWLRIKK